ncbi:MAG: hypothetical protein ACTHM6_01700 [Tepidisphaeraceae bacterium]
MNAEKAMIKNALQRVGDGGRLDAAHHDVGRHDRGVDDVEGDRRKVRDVGLQIAPADAVLQLVVPREVGLGELGGVELAFEVPVVGEFRDHRRLGRGVGGRGLDDHGGGDFVGNHVPDRQAEHAGEDGHPGIRHRERAAVKAIHEQVRHRHKTGAAKPDGSEPVEGREKECLVREPNAPDALAVDFGGNGGGAVGIGHESEVQEELQHRPERAAADEKVGLPMAPARRPDANQQNAAQADRDNDEIQPMQAERHGSSGETVERNGRSFSNIFRKIFSSPERKRLVLKGEGSKLPKMRAFSASEGWKFFMINNSFQVRYAAWAGRSLGRADSDAC